MTALKSKAASGLFYRKTRNETLGQAFVLIEGGKSTTHKHEQQHNITAWSAFEEVTCMSRDFYFNTKDEILAFMA